MKTIGLIGGMSWESTMTYYKVINEVVKQQLGGLHSAKILLYSLDFHEIERCQAAGNWKESAEILTDGAVRLERAGADFIVICTNTMHKVVPQIEAETSLPVLHIAAATAERLGQRQVRRVALLGTKYTMTQDFYKERLRQAGIEVVIPDPGDIEVVNRIIYQELCLGIISERSKAEYLRVIDGFKTKGAQGIVLGCTEIGLLIQQQDTDLPVFDTALIHAESAAFYAIGI